MSSFNKIKYSFVLCLALLFSFSLAGTIVVNGKTYNTPLINGNYVVNADSSIYDLVYLNSFVYGKEGYVLRIYDENRLDNLEFYGLETDYGSVGQNAIFPLHDVSNQYDYAMPYLFEIHFYTDGTFFSIGNVNVDSSSFPLDVNSYFYVQLISYYGYYDNDLDFLHLSHDVYEYNSITHVVGDLVIDAENINSPSVPSSFPSVLTQQQINTAVNDLFSSSVLVDNLPKQYSNFWVVYDTDTENFDVWFYPTNYVVTGILHINDEDSSIVDYYNFEFSAQNLSAFFTNSCYHFSKTPNYDWYLMDAFNINDRDSYHFYLDYYTQPVVYASPDISFIYTYNGSSDDAFIVSTFNIIDNNNQVITAEDVLSQTKTTNSIWNMLYNLFNPPTNNSNMSTIEGQHDSIIDKANNQSFFDLFNNSKNLIVSITSVTWLLTASSLLFNYFSSFLVLCCVFITISRVMR